jgi:predicted DNA-binding antitoxin AbrB/MazE fold protein
MNFTVEATYENGVLRVDKPLPLKDLERVRVTVDTETNWVQETAGLIRWTGDVESLERFAMDPEVDPQEGP